MSDFAVRLIRERNKHQITTAELARRIETRGSVVWMWEAGRVLPTGKLLIKVCKALNCSADYLLGLSDDPKMRKA
jgi:transcriptional regulator with XRE-family HTH domain